jgi:hypothetical protein
MIGRRSPTIPNDLPLPNRASAEKIPIPTTPPNELADARNRHITPPPPSFAQPIPIRPSVITPSDGHYRQYSQPYNLYDDDDDDNDDDGDEYDLDNEAAVEDEPLAPTSVPIAGSFANVPMELRQILASLCLGRLPEAQLDAKMGYGLPSGDVLTLLTGIIHETILYCAHCVRAKELVRRFDLTEEVLDRLPPALAVNTFRIFDYARTVLRCSYDQLFTHFPIAKLLDVCDIYVTKTLTRLFSADLVRQFDLTLSRHPADAACDAIALWEVIDRRLIPQYCSELAIARASSKPPHRVELPYPAVEALVLRLDRDILLLGDSILSCSVRELVACAGYLLMQALATNDGRLGRDRRSERAFLQRFDEPGFLPSRFAALSSDAVAFFSVLTARLTCDPQCNPDEWALDAVEPLMHHVAAAQKSIQDSLQGIFNPFIRELQAEFGIATVEEVVLATHQFSALQALTESIIGRLICRQARVHFNQDPEHYARLRRDTPTLARALFECLTHLEAQYNEAFKEMDRHLRTALRGASMAHRPRTVSQLTSLLSAPTAGAQQNGGEVGHDYSSNPFDDALDTESSDANEDSEESSTSSVIHSIVGDPLEVQFKADSEDAPARPAATFQRPQPGVSLPRDIAPVRTAEIAYGGTIRRQTNHSTGGGVGGGGSSPRVPPWAHRTNEAPAVDNSSPTRRRNASIATSKPILTNRESSVKAQSQNTSDIYLAMPWMSGSQPERADAFNRNGSHNNPTNRHLSDGRGRSFVAAGASRVSPPPPQAFIPSAHSTDAIPMLPLASVSSPGRGERDEDDREGGGGGLPQRSRAITTNAAGGHARHHSTSTSGGSTAWVPSRPGSPRLAFARSLTTTSSPTPTANRGSPEPMRSRNQSIGSSAAGMVARNPSF